MARKRTPELSRIAGFYATSNERIEEAQRRFEEARMTLTNAQTFGTEAHGTAAGKAFVDAAENYANALRTHARLVVEYAAERSS
jgi:hypothetical protein